MLIFNQIIDSLLHPANTSFNTLILTQCLWYHIITLSDLRLSPKLDSVSLVQF